MRGCVGVHRSPAGGFGRTRAYRIIAGTEGLTINGAVPELVTGRTVTPRQRMLGGSNPPRPTLQEQTMTDDEIDAAIRAAVPAECFVPNAGAREIYRAGYRAGILWNMLRGIGGWK